ncbi:MAG: hypothetical protein AB7P34_08675 [Vicinamibacterales bacterium]
MRGDGLESAILHALDDNASPGYRTISRKAEGPKQPDPPVRLDGGG